MSVSAFLPTTIVVETLEDQEIDSLQQPPSSRLLRLLPLLFDEFYVVQDTSTKKCTIVDKKPTVTTQTIVSPSGTVYKAQAEAEAGMKTVKVCTYCTSN